MLSKIVSIALVLVAGSSFAQENLEATKTPTKDLSTLIKPEFALMDYRYYYIQEYDAQNNLSLELPIHQARATLGFTLLNKVDTTFIFAGSKVNESQKITNRQPQMIASLPVVKGDIWSLAVYTDMRLPVAGKANTTEIGFNPHVDVPLARDWSLSVNGEFEMIFSNDSSTTVANYDRADSRYFLAGDATETDAQIAGAKKDPSAQSDVEALVKFTPAGMDGKLTVAAGVWFNTLWTPTYAFNEATGETETAYEDQSYSINRLKVDYKLTENLTLVDDFYYQVAGFYAEGAEGATHTDLGRVTNRIGLSYSLF